MVGKRPARHPARTPSKTWGVGSGHPDSVRRDGDLDVARHPAATVHRGAQSGHADGRHGPWHKEDEPEARVLSRCPRSRPASGSYRPDHAGDLDVWCGLEQRGDVRFRGPRSSRFDRVRFGEKEGARGCPWRWRRGAGRGATRPPVQRPWRGDSDPQTGQGVPHLTLVARRPGITAGQGAPRSVVGPSAHPRPGGPSLRCGAMQRVRCRRPRQRGPRRRCLECQFRVGIRGCLRSRPAGRSPTPAVPVGHLARASAGVTRAGARPRSSRPRSPLPSRAFS